jgi:GMP synthase-like glutamine amidotransferase
MFRTLLEEPGEEWEVVKLDSGDPVPASLAIYKGVIITGSRHCCRDADSLPWFVPLCNLIRDVHDLGTPRLYGGCFGCQIISVALGGVVGRNPGGEFLLKAETLTPVNSFSCVLMNEVTYEERFRVIVSHGDCVSKLPPTATWIATSATCEHEIYACGKSYPQNILAVQSHPEFEVEYCVTNRIWPKMVKQKRLSAENQIEYLDTFVNFSRDLGSDQLIQIIKQFLRL